MKKRFFVFVLMASALLFSSVAFSMRSDMPCTAFYSGCLKGGGSLKACNDGWRACMCNLYQTECD